MLPRQPLNRRQHPTDESFIHALDHDDTDLLQRLFSHGLSPTTIVPGTVLRCDPLSDFPFEGFYHIENLFLLQTTIERYRRRYSGFNADGVAESGKEVQPHKIFRLLMEQDIEVTPQDIDAAVYAGWEEALELLLKKAELKQPTY
jgi:hypothetical protein